MMCILPHEKIHGITFRCLKQVFIPIVQVLKCRALKYKERVTLGLGSYALI